jgi:hypothetical protein
VPAMRSSFLDDVPPAEPRKAEVCRGADSLTFA